MKIKTKYTIISISEVRALLTVFISKLVAIVRGKLIELVLQVTSGVQFSKNFFVYIYTIEISLAQVVGFGIKKRLSSLKKQLLRHIVIVDKMTSNWRDFFFLIRVF